MAGSDVTDPSLPKMLDSVGWEDFTPMTNLGGKIVSLRFHFPVQFRLQEM